MKFERVRFVGLRYDLSLPSHFAELALCRSSYWHSKYHSEVEGRKDVSTVIGGATPDRNQDIGANPCRFYSNDVGTAPCVRRPYLVFCHPLEGNQPSAVPVCSLKCSHRERMQRWFAIRRRHAEQDCAAPQRHYGNVLTATIRPQFVPTRGSEEPDVHHPRSCPRVSCAKRTTCCLMIVAISGPPWCWRACCCFTSFLLAPFLRVCTLNKLARARILEGLGSA